MNEQLAGKIPLLVQAAPERHWDDIMLYLPALPTVTVGVLAILGAHYFTKQRERSKAVFDLHSKIVQTVDECVTAAKAGWLEKPGHARNARIEETKGRLLSLGMSVDRIAKLSERWEWNSLAEPVKRPGIEKICIRCRPALVNFRRALTQDPFEDRQREEMPWMEREIELAKGEFIWQLDEAFNNWA